MKKLREALKNYFYAIDSVTQGLPAEIPEKPDALVMYDQCVAMGIPLIKGGLRDQPHIWLYEYAICQQEREYAKMLAKANKEKNGDPQLQQNPASSLATTLRSVGRV